jgi:hypothetical protein
MAKEESKTMRMSWGLLLSSVLTLLTALTACVAALGSQRAAKQSRRSTQAQVMNALFDMYESNALLDAEIRLRMWSTEHGKHFAHIFARLCRDDYAQVKVADHARRQLVHYFTKIYILWNMHLIDKTVVQLLLRRDQVMFLREVVEPLETALHMQDEQGMFQAFGKLYRVQPLSSPSAHPELSHDTHC